jgi:Fur family peroxide stress response transcriptional regulator
MPMHQATGNQDIGRLLKARGLRVTPQRVAICGRLLERHGHFTPHQLHDSLRDQFPSLSPNTVYLTLSQLESVGLVRRVHIGGHSVFDSNTGVHDHLCCDRCGRVQDLAPRRGRAAAPPEAGAWRIDHASRTFFGLCPACRATEARR